MPPFVDTFRALPPAPRPSSRSPPFAILAIAFLMLKLATAPSYTLLSSGLDPAQTGKITAALDEQGIGYELRNNGTGAGGRQGAGRAGAGRARRRGRQPRLQLGQRLRAVRQAEARRLRLPAAGHLPARAGGRDRPHDLRRPGRQQRRRSSSSCPEDDLFADQATPATAAVMLGNTADSLEPGAVRGIAQLVASSVKGLKTENVTITDASGSLLWPAGDGSSGAAGVPPASRPPRRATRTRWRPTSTRC